MNSERAIEEAGKFGQLYALLDNIRETSRRAEQIAGMILEQRNLELVESIGSATNNAIGEVLFAQKRMLHEHGVTTLRCCFSGPDHIQIQEALQINNFTLK